MWMKLELHIWKMVVSTNFCANKNSEWESFQPKFANSRTGISAAMWQLQV
jgi:hypothetical protein